MGLVLPVEMEVEDNAMVEEGADTIVEDAANVMAEEGVATMIEEGIDALVEERIDVEDGIDAVLEVSNEHEAFFPFFSFILSRLSCSSILSISPAGTQR
jgi:hypothetical protein